MIGDVPEWPSNWLEKHELNKKDCCDYYACHLFFFFFFFYYYFSFLNMIAFYLDVNRREDLENLAPDFQALLSAHSSGIIRGVIVTLQGTSTNGCLDDKGQVYDFVSRYFAPWVGIPEDPVTGKWRSLVCKRFLWQLQFGRQLYFAQKKETLM